MNDDYVPDSEISVEDELLGEARRRELYAEQCDERALEHDREAHSLRERAISLRAAAKRLREIVAQPSP